MYTIPPSPPRHGLSYKWGLRFIAATTPAMLGLSWLSGGFRTSPMFYACTLGLIPISLMVWPVMAAGLRHGKRWHRLLGIAGLAIIGPCGYVGMLMLINSHGHRFLRSLVYAAGRDLLKSSFSMRAGTGTTLWIEALSAWVIVLMVIVATLRRWRPVHERDV